MCKLYHFVQLRERGREKGLDGWGVGVDGGIYLGKCRLGGKVLRVSYMLAFCKISVYLDT